MNSLQLYITKNKNTKIIPSVILPLFFIIFKPLGMSLAQSIVLGGLIQSIIWWTTNIVPNIITSVFLICILLFFGKTPTTSVLNFVTSGNIIFVCAAYLISQGIINSKVAQKFSQYILGRYCRNGKSLVIMAFFLNLLFALAIPQALPRVILLSTIYSSFLDQNNINGENRSVILYGIVVGSTIISRIFLNSDIIVNYSALQFGNLSISNSRWVTLMLVPTVITAVVVVCAFCIIFRKNLTDVLQAKKIDYRLKFDIIEIKALTILLIIIILWLTESLHGISPVWIAVLGVITMYIFKLLSFKDKKVINWEILISLTAQFAIGSVLNNNGTAQIISGYVKSFLPNAQSGLYIPFIILVIFVIHFFVGSLVTALAIVVPIILSITTGILDPEMAVLFSLISISFQYVLPFHHITVTLGYGARYYSVKQTLKFAPALAIITFCCILLFYLPWWRMML